MLELIVAPLGAPASRLKFSVLAGESLSAALAVKVMGVPSDPLVFPMSASTGAVLTSFTVTVMVSQSLTRPSLTQTSKV